MCVISGAPFLPELLGRLRACGELSDLSPGLVDRVANMSAATIDRMLGPYRALSGGRGRSMTRPARCYATRCRSRPSPTGMVHGLVF